MTKECPAQAFKELWHAPTIQRMDVGRLEGFKDPWDATVFRGRACLPDKTLQELGITSGAEVITVRRKLIPEGALVQHDSLMYVTW